MVCRMYLEKMKFMVEVSEQICKIWVETLLSDIWQSIKTIFRWIMTKVAHMKYDRTIKNIEHKHIPFTFYFLMHFKLPH